MNMIENLRSLVSTFPVTEIDDLDFPVMFIIQRCYDTVKSNSNISDNLLFKVESCIDRVHEKINIGHWKDVRISYRKSITVLSYFKTLAIIERTENITQDAFAAAFETIDRGLLFGAPLTSNNSHDLLHQCAYILNQQKYIKKYEKPMEIEKDLFDEMASCYKDVLMENIDQNQQNNEDENDFINIERISCPSVEYFWNTYFMNHAPIILTNCMDHWPAIKSWQNMDYILEKAGHRIVPVEIGSKYTDSNWTQKLMPLHEFIEENILKENCEITYLAQHQLFNQIPELKSDILEPDYCCLQEHCDEDSVEETDINAWFGPAGTISPLHFDPKHNLLAQVVGSKEIILYSSEDSDYLYPHPDNLLKNTSEVDFENPDLEKFPLLRNAQQFRCTLNQGEMLYIPPKWWHHIKSLSVSFSVSFWWS